MELTIIAQNPLYRKTLEKALSSLGVTIELFGRLQDVSLSGAPSQKLYLWVVSDDELDRAADFSRQNDCFALFLTPSFKEDKAQTEDFLAVFNSPVRLGAVADSLRVYLRQRAQRHSLKPLTMGRFTLNPRSNMLEDKSTKQAIRLTEKEQDILIYLQARSNEAVSRQDLLDYVWGYAKDVETHTLETHIYRLRQKIEEDPSIPSFLITNEQGYTLNL